MAEISKSGINLGRPVNNFAVHGPARSKVSEKKAGRLGPAHSKVN